MKTKRSAKWLFDDISNKRKRPKKNLLGERIRLSQDLNTYCCSSTARSPCVAEAP